MTRWIACLGYLALAAAAPVAMQACAAEAPSAPARSYETGKLTIGGEAFPAGDIADARAMPDINKKIGIMLSLTPDAARRLEGLSAKLVGKPMTVALDGRALSSEPVRKPVSSGVIEIPGRWTLTDAEALARRISGKDPLPDDLGM